jgi:BirA family biotin operon repressor/biotin-[acetyl-CoA-carboxylase] ligase
LFQITIHVNMHIACGLVLEFHSCEKKSDASLAMRLGVPFDQAAFSRFLPGTCSLGRRFEYKSSIASTMDVARELVGAEGGVALHGTVVLTDDQTAGVGRRGRSWDSEACCSLLFSLIWAPAAVGTPALFPELVRLNLAAPIAVVCACSAVGVDSALIKWPNDVWAGATPRKLSGVILDYNGGDSAVLGVGVNVLQDMSRHPASTSIATLLAASPAPTTTPAIPGVLPNSPGLPELRERVLSSFCVELERLMRMETSAVIAEHGRYDLLENKTIRVHHKTRDEHDPRDYDAVALGLGPDGGLRVRPLAAAGSEVCLSAEEISITPYLNIEPS